MELTEARKKIIDGMHYEALLGVWRFAPEGDPWMEGETGKYWKERMGELKNKDPKEAVRASKKLGW